jgi:hypothetical protein
MVAIRASDVDSFLARPDPARPVVLVFGPDAGLVSERVNALICVRDDPGSATHHFVLRCARETHTSPRQNSLEFRNGRDQSFRRRFPSSRAPIRRGRSCLSSVPTPAWLASGSTRLLIYQRMLANDPIEAAEQARTFLKEKPLVEYYDEILLEGLRLAEADFQARSAQ